MHLDAAAARRSIEVTIAKPLRVSVEAAAVAAIDVLTQNMVSAIEEITVQQGIDPKETVLVAGGGAAGFNSIRIGQKLGCAAVLFPETGAALSAAGAILSDLVFTAGRVRYIRSDAPDLSAVEETMGELAAEISSDVAGLRVELPEIEYWVEARYAQQTWEIEVPLRTPLLAGVAVLEDIVLTFHPIHEKLYAVCDRASPIEIIEWRARASCHLSSPGHLRLVPKETRNGTHTRKIFLAETGWTDATVRPLHASESAGEINGPAIIESPFMTIFVPPGTSAIRLASGDLRADLLQKGVR
jgi:N-methylhydantoinase A